GHKIEETIHLLEANGPYDLGYNDADTYRIGYGITGFETFHVDVPESLRGQVATVKFEIEEGTVYLDDVFFKSEHLLLGNPTLNGQEARPDLASHANNYLIERPQYSLSYNESNKGPNWVSWQLNRSWLGNLSAPSRGVRPVTDPYPWQSDRLLPDHLNTTEGFEYFADSRYPREVSLDRGHVMAREKRNRTQKDQWATYFTTNLLPQEIDNNRHGAWRKLETFSLGIVKYRGWEVYNIAGGSGSQNLFYEPQDPLNVYNINIPEFMWNVFLVLKPGQGIQDVTIDTPVVAVNLPNFIQNPPDIIPLPWYHPYNLTTVDAIEEMTGLDLLSHLPDEIEEIIEARTYDGPTTVENFPYVS
uniref:DNA/RNA non-specific endonuclease n=1 Tax=Oscillatoria sp. HE19RPO TaxID=2954806 RepID=UPI0020C4BFFA